MKLHPKNEKNYTNNEHYYLELKIVIPYLLTYGEFSQKHIDKIKYIINNIPFFYITLSCTALTVFTVCNV